MPQLTVRGVPLEQLLMVSVSLCRELAEICGCPEDNFTIDCLQVVSVTGGSLGPTYPFVEVAWFERGEEVRNRVAEAIDRHMRFGSRAAVHELEIAFKTYKEDAYYINGVPCSSGSQQ